jgi:hypothetical protein
VNAVGDSPRQENLDPDLQYLAHATPFANTAFLPRRLWNLVDRLFLPIRPNWNRPLLDVSWNDLFECISSKSAAPKLPESGKGTTKEALRLCVRCVSDTSRRQDTRHVKACHANPVVGHPIVNVEAFRRAEIVATVNSGREHNIRDGPVAFLR